MDWLNIILLTMFLGAWELLGRWFVLWEVPPWYTYLARCLRRQRGRRRQGGSADAPKSLPNEHHVKLKVPQVVCPIDGPQTSWVTFDQGTPREKAFCCVCIGRLLEQSLPSLTVEEVEIRKRGPL